MTQNDEKNHTSQQSLCLKCKDMFGHVNFDYMCSVCYKKQKNLDTIIQKSKPQAIAQSESDVKQIHLKPQALNFKRQLPKQEPEIEVNKGKCMKCSKKTGMLGYACKHCTLQFCKFHRLPEDHSCQVDFITLGKKKIKTENPIINTKKIEDI